MNSSINKVLYIDKVTKKIAVYDGDCRAFEKKHAQELKLRECTIVHQEREMIQNVFEFDGLTVGEFATHRTELALLWMDETAEEWEKPGKI